MRETFPIEALVFIPILIGLFYYIRFLMRMKRSNNEVLLKEPGQPQSGFSETELERYARHIVLREIGGSGQQKLAAARVLVVGAGGLGCPILHYLAAAGVGTIGVIDDDTVSLSNLQRQVLFNEDDLGKPKVLAAKQKLAKLNPHIDVLCYERKLDAQIAADLFADYDFILDGTDSFATRTMVNAAAVATQRPLVSGAISQWEGQISIFDPATGSPCYTCLFPNEPAEGQAPTCAEAGVMGALPGVIGSMMAAEAIKLICGVGVPLHSVLLIYDALDGESRKISIERDPNCQVCRS